MSGSGQQGMARPPEGAISGDSVPRENELDDSEEQTVQEVIGELKGKGEPWINMSDNEIRERVKDRLVDKGVIR